MVRVSSVRRVAVAAILPVLLAGCGTISPYLGGFGGSSDSGDATTPAASQVATADQVAATPAPASGPYRVNIDVAAECPQARVPTGGSSVTTPAGTAGTSRVRYQIAITDVARECSLEPGNEVLIKIGVRGVVSVGAAGSPGALSAPLTVTIKDRDGGVVATSTAKVGATVGADAAPARFQTVLAPIRVPISLSKPLHTLDIYVSLQGKV